MADITDKFKKFPVLESDGFRINLREFATDSDFRKRYSAGYSSVIFGYNGERPLCYFKGDSQRIEAHFRDDFAYPNILHTHRIFKGGSEVYTKEELELDTMALNLQLTPWIPLEKVIEALRIK